MISIIDISTWESQGIWVAQSLDDLYSFAVGRTEKEAIDKLRDYPVDDCWDDSGCLIVDNEELWG